MKQSFFRIKYENLSELWEKCCSFKTKLIRICNDDVCSFEYLLSSIDIKQKYETNFNAQVILLISKTLNSSGSGGWI